VPLKPDPTFYPSPRSAAAAPPEEYAYVVTLNDAGTGAAAPDRIAAQVVTGIGFLGAGAILRSGENVHGLTTAATIWVNAAIGMAAGLGSYTVATVAAAITLTVLALMPVMEKMVDKRRGERP